MKKKTNIRNEDQEQQQQQQQQPHKFLPIIELLFWTDRLGSWLAKAGRGRLSLVDAVMNQRGNDLWFTQAKW